jgi:cell fate regulator YaaT (PSP1 superfamily)
LIKIPHQVVPPVTMANTTKIHPNKNDIIERKTYVKEAFNDKQQDVAKQYKTTVFHNFLNSTITSYTARTSTF